MTPTILAAVESVLLIAGAVGAGRLASGLSSSGSRSVRVMASISAWFILFGMVPFLVYALFAGQVAVDRVGPVETFILNLIPWALAISPIIGFLQGRRIRASST